MSTIGSVDQLVAVIQAQLATRAPATPAGPAPARKPARATQGSKAGQGRYARHNLAGLIELRIAQIARDDPQRGRKAFRVFLEAVLLGHLGEALVGDPRFFQLVDDVQLALEADAACAALVATAIGELLAPAASD